MSREEQQEQLKRAYDTYMEEFKSIREERNANIDSSRQTLTIALTATGFLIGASPSIVNSHIPLLFLVAALPFYIISWVQIRYIFFQNNLGDYLENTLIPIIKSSISNISPKSKLDVTNILGWQLRWRRRYQSLLLLPATAAYYGVPLFTAILSFSAYFIYCAEIKTLQTFVDYLLIGINVVFFLYSLILGVWAYRSFSPKRK